MNYLIITLVDYIKLRHDGWLVSMNMNLFIISAIALSQEKERVGRMWEKMSRRYVRRVCIIIGQVKFKWNSTYHLYANVMYLVVQVTNPINY